MLFPKDPRVKVHVEEDRLTITYPWFRWIGWNLILLGAPGFVFFAYAITRLSDIWSWAACGILALIWMPLLWAGISYAFNVTVVEVDRERLVLYSKPLPSSQNQSIPVSSIKDFVNLLDSELSYSSFHNKRKRLIDNLHGKAAIRQVAHILQTFYNLPLIDRPTIREAPSRTHTKEKAKIKVTRTAERLILSWPHFRLAAWVCGFCGILSLAFPLLYYIGPKPPPHNLDELAIWVSFGALAGISFYFTAAFALNTVTLVADFQKVTCYSKPVPIQPVRSFVMNDAKQFCAIAVPDHPTDAQSALFVIDGDEKLQYLACRIPNQASRNAVVAELQDFYGLQAQDVDGFTSS